MITCRCHIAKFKFACIVQYGYTSLHLAAHNGHVEVIVSLTKSGADINVVEKVNQCKNTIDYCILLYSMKQFVCIVQDEWTPLHLALRNGHIEVVETLIKSGADINFAQKVNQHENTDITVHYCTVCINLYALCRMDILLYILLFELVVLKQQRL